MQGLSFHGGFHSNITLLLKYCLPLSTSLAICCFNSSGSKIVKWGSHLWINGKISKGCVYFKVKIIQSLYIIALISTFSTVNLNAEEFVIDIKYFGLTVVRADITMSNDVLSISARSTGIASIASRMNNTYEILLDDVMLPISYKKVINQRKYKENRIIFYDRSNSVAKRKSFLDPANNKIYPVKHNSRDFFSALFFWREHQDQDSGEFWLDASGLIWKAKYVKLENEIIKTGLGKMNCSKFLLNCQKISEEESEWSDMLTNNLVNEKVPLIFWFSDDDLKLPVKIKFKMSPFPVIWQLKSYYE